MAKAKKAQNCTSKRRKCATPYCRRKKAKRGRHCYHCQHEKRKQDNPYLYWYGVRRRNAKRRALKSGNGKFWYVTFEYWVKFCDDTGYLALVGRNKYDGSVDCENNDLGYVDGNLKLLTVGDNASKGTKKITWNYLTHEWEVVAQNCAAIVPAHDLPF